jgi:hypothetical protein
MSSGLFSQFHFGGHTLWFNEHICVFVCAFREYISRSSIVGQKCVHTDSDGVPNQPPAHLHLIQANLGQEMLVCYCCLVRQRHFLMFLNCVL